MQKYYMTDKATQEAIEFNQALDDSFQAMDEAETLCKKFGILDDISEDDEMDLMALELLLS